MVRRTHVLPHPLLLFTLLFSLVHPFHFTVHLLSRSVYSHSCRFGMDHSDLPSETDAFHFRENSAHLKYPVQLSLPSHVKSFDIPASQEESKANQHEKFLISSNMRIWDVTISHVD